MPTKGQPALYHERMKHKRGDHDNEDRDNDQEEKNENDVGNQEQTRTGLRNGEKKRSDVHLE